MANRQQFQGYFLCTDEYSSNVILVPQEPWSPTLEKVLIREGITGLRLSYSAGWREHDISFLRHLPMLRQVEIYNWDVTDIAPLASLPLLENIGITCNYKKELDFTMFQQLQHCDLTWRPKSASIFQVPSLHYLNINNYPYEDLTPLRQLTNLKTLQIGPSRRLQTLDGGRYLKKLSALHFYAASRLETLEGLEPTTTLKFLDMQSCKKVHNVNPLTSLRNLQRVGINNCGPITSLRPLKKCQQLKELFFGENTNIEDGDVSIFQDLPLLQKMYFQNRKHYSHSREAIAEWLDNKICP